MVDTGSLLSCVVVVVIRKQFGVWDNIGTSITRGWRIEISHTGVR